MVGLGLPTGSRTTSAFLTAQPGALGGTSEATPRDIIAGLVGRGCGAGNTLKNRGRGGEDADGRFVLRRLLRPGRSFAPQALRWLPLRR
jgi:hypothetical protein